MKKKFLVWLLCLCMIFTMVPVMPASAAEPASPEDQLLEPTAKPEGYDQKDETNPYGTKRNQPFLKNTVDELLLYTHNGDTQSGNSKVSDAVYNPGQIGSAGNKYSYAERGVVTSATRDITHNLSYSFVSSVAFDPDGSGRKDHVAYIGCDYNDKSLHYWVQNIKTGQLISNTRVATLGDWITTLDQWGYKNFFTITAGDYDGDGKDTTVIYVPKEYNVLFEMNKSGYVGYINSDAFYGEALPVSNNASNRLTMSLASGDFNNDGIDELASVCGILNHTDLAGSNKTAGDFNASTTHLTVFNGSSGTFRPIFHDRLRTQKKDNVHPMYNGIRSAGITAGDVDGDGCEDLVIAGYLNQSIEYVDAYGNVQYYGELTSIKSTAAFCTYYGATNKRTDVYTTELNAFTKSGLYDVDTWPQAAVSCVAINGRGQKEAVFIMGTLYDWSSASAPQKLYTASQMDTGKESGTTSAWVESVIVGNFDGNFAGREQVVYTVAQKSNMARWYWYRVDTLGGTGYKDTDESFGAATGYYEFDFNDYSINKVSGGWNKPCACVVVPIDNNEDGIKVRFAEKFYSYSDAKVETILQGAPYFAELGDYDLDFSDGETSWSVTTGYSSSTSSSDSVSSSLCYTMEFEGKVVKGSFEIGLGVDWTQSYEHVISEEYTTTLAAGGDNLVVVYRVPITMYCYEVYDPVTGQWKKDADNQMVIGIPGKPTYVSMDTDAYNQFADTYNTKYKNDIEKKEVKPLKPIKNGDNIVPEATRGDPFAYWHDSAGASGFKSLSSTPLPLGHSGGSATSEWTRSEEFANGYEIAHGLNLGGSVMGGFSAAGVGAWAGVTASVEYRHATGYVYTTINARGASGTINNIDVNGLNIAYGIPKTVAEAYKFDWDFGMVQRDMWGGEEIPVFCYVLTNVTAPTPPPILNEAVMLDYTTVNLSWQAPTNTSRPFVGYNVWQEVNGNYVKLNEQPLQEQSFVCKNLKSNTEYGFAITTQGRGSGAVNSVFSNKKTIVTPKKSCLLTLKSDPLGTANVTATFEGDKEAVSGKKYEEGTMLHVSATAKLGFAITGYTMHSLGSEPVERKVPITNSTSFDVFLADDVEVVVQTQRVNGIVHYGVNDESRGSVTATIGGYPFVSGDAARTSINFTAAPTSGYVLTDWRVTTDGVDKLYVADGLTFEFAPLGNTHTVTALFGPLIDSNVVVNIPSLRHGQITVTDETGQPLTPIDGLLTVGKGSRLMFTATPNQGYVFDRWDKDLVTYIDTNPVTVTVKQNMTVGAVFFAPSERSVVYAVYENNGVDTPVASNTVGQIVALQNGESFTSGQAFVPDTSNFIFTAMSASNYDFVKWVVNGVDSPQVGAVLTIPKLERATTIQAHFGPSLPRPVDAPAATPGTGIYDNPQTVSLSATPGAEIYYTLDGSVPQQPVGKSSVSDSTQLYTAPITVANSARLRAIAVNGSQVSPVANELYTITSESISVITATAGANGTITPAGAVNVVNNTNQTFYIAANADYIVRDVKVDGVSVGAVNAYEFTNVTEPHTIEATFYYRNPPTHHITATAGNYGTISPSGDVGVLDETSKIFTITPEYDCTIADVKVDGNSVSLGTDNTYEFTNVTASHTIDVTFIGPPVRHNITATAGNGGNITPQLSLGVIEGENQTFTITPDVGYKITDVKVDGASVGAVSTYEFTNVTAVHTIDVTFERIKYVLTATAAANGKISPSGAMDIYYGENQTFTITPDVGYKITDVKVDGASVGAVSTYEFTNVTAPHSIAATFERIKYVLTATAAANGKISPNGAMDVYYGENQTFTITPDVGYKITDVKVDGEIVSLGTDNTYEFTNVTAAHSIAATFERIKYVITATAAANGKISPSGAVNIYYGENPTFTITPDVGFKITDVKVDGVSVGNGNTYEFKNVIAPHSIEATFVRKGGSIGSGGDVISQNYKLTFATNGGSTIDAVSGAANTKVDVSKYVPTLQGFTFDGWYTDKELTKKITAITLSNDTTVYAKWNAVSNLPFTDVELDDWFSQYVEYVYKNDIMQGITDTEFSPYLATTRGMIVTVLWRMEGKPTATKESNFPDLTADWYKAAVNWGAENNIVLGYSNGKFGPMDNITREQMAAIFWRYAKYKGYDVSIGEKTSLLGYSDAAQVSAYAVPAMQWACGIGLMQGADGKLMPLDGAQRCQLAAVFMRFMENFKK